MFCMYKFNSNSRNVNYGIQLINLSKDHADHPPDQKNVRSGLHADVAVHVHAANVQNRDLDGLAPNPNPDHPSPSIQTSLRIRIERGVARISQIMAKEAIVIEKDPKRRAKAKRSPARRARDLATNRNRNNRRTRADHRKIMITKKKRQSRKLRRIFYYLTSSSCLRSIIFFISKAIFFFSLYSYSNKNI